MTMLKRSTAGASPKFALTPLEIELLDRLVKDKATRKSQRKTLSDYLTKIAQLGGYLARASDPRRRGAVSVARRRLVGLAQQRNAKSHRHFS
jgi:hypothetical protein